MAPIFEKAINDHPEAFAQVMSLATSLDHGHDKKGKTDGRPFGIALARCLGVSMSEGQGDGYLPQAFQDVSKAMGTANGDHPDLHALVRESVTHGEVGASHRSVQATQLVDNKMVEAQSKNLTSEQAFAHVYATPEEKEIGVKGLNAHPLLARDALLLTVIKHPEVLKGLGKAMHRDGHNIYGDLLEMLTDTKNAYAQYQKTQKPEDLAHVQKTFGQYFERMESKPEKRRHERLEIAMKDLVSVFGNDTVLSAAMVDAIGTSPAVRDAFMAATSDVIKSTDGTYRTDFSQAPGKHARKVEGSVNDKIYNGATYESAFMTLATDQATGDIKAHKGIFNLGRNPVTISEQQALNFSTAVGQSTTTEAEKAAAQTTTTTSQTAAADAQADTSATPAKHSGFHWPHLFGGKAKKAAATSDAAVVDDAPVTKTAGTNGTVTNTANAPIDQSAAALSKAAKIARSSGATIQIGTDGVVHSIPATGQTTTNGTQAAGNATNGNAANATQNASDTNGSGWGNTTDAANGGQAATGNNGSSTPGQATTGGNTTVTPGQAAGGNGTLGNSSANDGTNGTVSNNASGQATTTNTATEGNTVVTPGQAASGSNATLGNALGNNGANGTVSTDASGQATGTNGTAPASLTPLAAALAANPGNYNFGTSGNSALNNATPILATTPADIAALTAAQAPGAPAGALQAAQAAIASNWVTTQIAAGNLPALPTVPGETPMTAQTAGAFLVATGAVTVGTVEGLMNPIASQSLTSTLGLSPGAASGISKEWLIPWWSHHTTIIHIPGDCHCLPTPTTPVIPTPNGHDIGGF